MPDSPIRVLVVEDYTAYRRFLVSTMQSRAELQVIGEVADGLEAVQKARELQPDLILLDLGLPGLNGIEAARRIRTLSPHSKILFVSDNQSTDVIEEALRTGALGYVVKSDAARDLFPAWTPSFRVRSLSVPVCRFSWTATVEMSGQGICSRSERCKTSAAQRCDRGRSQGSVLFRRPATSG